MPLPKPHDGESQDDFISRCMSDETAQSDFPEQEDRLGFCFSQWREEHGGEPPPKDRGIERKSLRVEVKDAEKGIVLAAFAKLGAKDHDDDWTLPGAFGEQKVRVSAYGHGSWMGELPVGKGVIKEMDGEALAELKFFMSTTHGREHFEVIKQMGDLQEWSYGFDVLETGELTDELKDKGVRRVLKKLKVHEVSPVLLGAGVDTRTLAVKELLGDPLVVPIRFELVDKKEETVTTKTDEDKAAEEQAAEEARLAEEKAAEEKAAAEQAAEEARIAELRADVEKERERFQRNLQRYGR